MRRRGRKYLVGAAAAVGVIALAITPAAGVAKPRQPKLGKNLVSCVAKVSIAVPEGAASQGQVFPDQTPGQQWGSVHCGKGIGAGLEELSYKIPVSGDEVGTFVAYFGGATIKGKFDLAPQTGTLLGSGPTGLFGYSAFAGPLTHMSATGALTSTTTGSGLASCIAEDGVHFKCVEKL
jgi:hypothetical protein